MSGSASDELFAAGDTILFDIYGVEAIYDCDRLCRVIEDRETLWLQGEESSSARTEITLSFLLSEVCPERGKVVTFGTKTYKLGKQIENDGSVAKHLVER